MKSIIRLAPPVLEAGPTRAFWSPATARPAPGALRAGTQLLHTPDAVGLTGILGDFALGRNAVTEVRGSGLNGLGATHRVALDVDIVR